MLDNTEELPINKKRSKLQPKWKNAPTYDDLYNDYASAESSQNALKDKLEIWNETRNGGAKITPIGPGKSTARPLVVRKANEWKYPALEDPILSTSTLFIVDPSTSIDTDAAKQNGKVLNYQWNTKVQKTKLVGDIVRTVVDEGTVIVKTGWDFDTEMRVVEEEVPVYASPEESLMMIQQAVQSGQMPQEKAQAMLETGEPMSKGTKLQKVRKEVVTKNQPSYEVCITADVTIDPTCDGVVADAMFAIHEYDTSYAELKSEEYGIEENGEEYGVYHNLNKIKGSSEDGEYNQFKSDASNNFEFKDNARKRLKAYEYWGYWDIQGDGNLVSIVATWVNKILIRLEENPFPHGRIPFSVATYMPVKKSVHGEPDAELLKDNQDAVGRMTRAIQDITAKQAVGQEFIDENFFPSPSTKNQYEKGNTVYYRSNMDPRRAIFRQDIPQVGSTPFDIIKWQTIDADELTGTKPFGGRGGAKLEGGERSKDSMDATAKREASILRRLSELLFVDMARMTIAMNQEFLDEETVVRITDKEFVKVKRDDLMGDFDLRVKVNTPEADNDKATKIMKLMQTNAATMDPEIVKMHYVKLAELWKMDDLAAKVEEYQPKPDPMKQELLKLQIEEQRIKNAMLQKDMEDLDSKIFERLSRTKQNEQMDVKLANAKAEQALAVAEKLKSETDLIDASFVKLQTGEKRLEDVQDQQFKADVDLTKEQKKSDLQMAQKQFKRASLNVPACS